MSQQRIPARPRAPPIPNVSTSSPLLSSSTITFLASWRGQLLICTVVLILGGVYFVLQEPIEQYRRRRREALSRVRGEELMSMDKEKVVEKEVEESPKEKRGREKKKDVKKRKGSLLRVPAAMGSGDSSVGVSSIESSPAPARIPLATPPRPRASPSKAKALALPSVEEVKTFLPIALEPEANGERLEEISPKRTLQPSLLPPSDITPKTHRTQPPAATSPFDIPLPDSPIAGPSRSPLLSVTDIESIDGDYGTTSESALDNAQNSDAPSSSAKPKPQPIEFSIIPEEGYLPISQPVSGKKKKRRNRAPPPQPLASLERRQSGADAPVTPAGGSAIAPDSPVVPVTPSRHARKASLNRPVNADLEALLTERERMIETLRAENGVAKAEEAKAKDELSRARSVEDRLKGDIERARKGGQKMENDGRKRESELTARLNHLNGLYAGAVQRINALEAMFRDQGHAMPPPPSPGMMFPGNSPSLIPIQHLQPMPSPLPPPSPFNMGYNPSPRAVSAGFVPFPSPGMFPSPMLHPNFHHPHSHSPSPFRRASTTGPTDELAGPLTPGHVMQNGSVPSSGQYPFDLGIMPSPSSAHLQPSPNGQPNAADLRRLSIESSVLKKKHKEARSEAGSGDGDSNRGSDPLPDIDESVSVQGLGMGDVGGSNVVESHGGSANGRDRDDGDSIRSDSHQSSPSPPNRASMLLTPASADVFHRALVNGSDASDTFGTREAMGDVKVIRDAEHGSLYFRMGSGSSSETDEPAEELYNGDHERNGVNGKRSGKDMDVSMDVEAQEVQENGLGSEEDFVPMFASLAHTPQQVAEINRMKQEAIMARQRGAGGRSASTSSVTAT